MAVPNEKKSVYESIKRVIPLFLTTKTFVRRIFINIVQIEHNFSLAECFSAINSVRVYFTIESEI